jgi:exopolysaccharide production protein ExoQ
MNAMRASRFGVRRSAQRSAVTAAHAAHLPRRNRWVVDSKFGWLTSSMLVGMFLYMCIPENVWSGRPPPTALEIATTAPNPLYRTLKLVLLVVGFGVIVWRFALARQVIRKLNVFLPAFAALVALSITWSITPDATTLRLAAVVNIFMVSCSFVLVSWHAQRFQHVVRGVLTVFLFASLIACMLWPDIAKETGPGISLENAWRGVFSTKNTMGEAASIGAIFWIHGWLAGEVKLWRFLFGGGIAIACVVLSHSSTSIMATVFATLLLIVLMREGIRKSRAAPYLIVLILATVAFYTLAELEIIPGLQVLLGPIAESVGKDTSFSGRTVIWAILRDHIAEHPVLGTGYGAYWIGPLPSSPSYVFVLAKIAYPPEGHNGYLDVINDLGYVGLTCLIGYICVYVWQCFKLRDAGAPATLFLALLFQQLIGNTTQSMWFQSNALPFLVMTAASFAMARMMVEQQFRDALPASRAKR